MSKFSLTRKQLLAATGTAAAAVPLAKFASASEAAEKSATHIHGDAHLGHAAMIGEGVPAPGGPNDLDDLLIPPPALPYEPGRVREYTLVARDEDIEVAQGVTFPAWTYNGTVPGPIIRATEGDLLRVEFANAGSHPHTIHFHGIHPANMDGVFEIVDPGELVHLRVPRAPVRDAPLPLPRDPAEEAHPQGPLRRVHHRPADPRKPAHELVMVMNGYDTDGDGENNFYTVNGKAFYYAKYPIQVRRSETVRIYLANLTEFDLLNSFHLHGEFFRYYPTGSSDHFEYTDTVVQCQGERGIIEIDFHNTGKFMFHAHQSEFAELGWMGFFDVVD